ncbi:MAG: hypothetical protein HYS98_08645 [Deltaproteobacteria bacterium]|nr:hypothetical protein [Deltaproteobacteria bacterium]
MITEGYFPPLTKSKYNIRGLIPKPANINNLREGVKQTLRTLPYVLDAEVNSYDEDANILLTGIVTVNGEFIERFSEQKIIGQITRLLETEHKARKVGVGISIYQEGVED